MLATVTTREPSVRLMEASSREPYNIDRSFGDARLQLSR
jgi:hypothetical protein